MSNDLIEKTIEASQQWKNFFNEGSATGCASMYEEDAIMIAKPFGTFKGRQHIEAFWQNLLEQGFKDVSYVEPTVEAIDENSAVLTSKWTMNNA